MKWLRIVGLVGLFLAMNGIMLGSDPEKRLQVRWSELKKVIRGKIVTLQLADGTQVKGGRVKRVKESSVVLWVKRSSDYPKGQIEVAREAVSRIEALDVNANLVARRAKKATQTVGAVVGVLVGTFALSHVWGPDQGSRAPALWAGIGIGSAVAVLMNLPRGSRDVTLIEIIPDSPGEGEPQPTNKDRSSTPTASGEALDASLIEESSAERLRRQARRAVMRQDLPLDLSSLPVHAHKQTDEGSMETKQLDKF